jgi:GNAT superfamily N-acetyltransferase
VTEASTEADLVIRHADDVEEAAGILEEAIEWAAALGFDSWTRGSFADPGGWGRERLHEALRSDALYLVLRGREPVATFSLLPEDTLFWPEAAEDALYLHRFAVRRAHRGGRIGTLSLHFMLEEVLRAGRRYLRLDCLAENPGIRRYYERAGFVHRGDTVVNDMPFSLYELAVDGPRS